MSKTQPPASTNGGGLGEKSSYFEQQRALLMRDVSTNLEQVLQNVNRLNRSLEGIIAVGNEFSSVEALWSHFESVMAKEEEGDDGEKSGQGDGPDEAKRGSESVKT